MNLSTQPYKGARDFYPEDKRIQDYMFKKLSEVCERFGYEKYDAPILEPTDLFLAKGNQEIIDEQTYTFVDRGERSVTIRTEMTPSISRMVAGRRQELGYPLRWYSVPEMWRYERMQRGRLRQFWQLNADIFGVQGVEAEHEMICLVDRALKSFGASASMYSIRFNHRGLTNYIFAEYLGLPEAQRVAMIRLVDRMHKLDHAVFVAQAEGLLSPGQRDAGVFDRLMKVLEAKNIKDLPEEALQTDSARELMALDEMFKQDGTVKVEFDMTLMRGFDYYTGIVFEVFDVHPDNNRAMAGGGRYDGLVGMFGVEPVPTVGLGLGDVPLQLFLEVNGLLPKASSPTDVYVALVGDGLYEKSLSIVGRLRDAGLSVAVDPTGRKLDKQIKSALKKDIPFVLVVGDAELESGQLRLKNLASGAEESHSFERIVSIVADKRRSKKSKAADDDLDDL